MSRASRTGTSRIGPWETRRVRPSGRAIGGPGTTPTSRPCTHASRRARWRDRTSSPCSYRSSTS